LLLREEIHVARELGGEVPHALASSLLRQTILADISGCTPEQLARQTPTEATSQRFQPFSFSAVIARGAPVAFTSRIVSIAVSAAIYPSVRPLSSTWLAGRKNVSPHTLILKTHWPARLLYGPLRLQVLAGVRFFGRTISVRLPVSSWQIDEV